VQYDAIDTSHPPPHAYPALQSDNELSMLEKEGAHSFARKRKFRQIRPLFFTILEERMETEKQ